MKFNSVIRFKKQPKFPKKTKKKTKKKRLTCFDFCFVISYTDYGKLYIPTLITLIKLGNQSKIKEEKDIKFFGNKEESEILRWFSTALSYLVISSNVFKKKNLIVVWIDNNFALKNIMVFKKASDEENWIIFNLKFKLRIISFLIFFCKKIGKLEKYLKEKK